MKKIFLILFLIILVAGGVFFVEQYKRKIIPQENQQPTVLEISDIKNAYKEDPLNITIEYPQVAGLDDFNSKVKSIVDSKLNEFKSNALANDQAIKQVDPESYAKYPREYEFQMSYTLSQTDTNILSVVLNEHSFEGGAHGATLYTSINYDVNKKLEIKLSDLFKDDQDYLKNISEFCIKDLTNQMTILGSIDMTNDNWIQEGAGPKEENYDIFLVNKDNIVFYFPQYQVAAYAAGDFKVIYPR